MENVVNQNIKSLRLILGLSQVEFAKPLKVSDGLISKIEAGEIPASNHVISRITLVYRIQISRLTAADFLEV